MPPMREWLWGRTVPTETAKWPRIRRIARSTTMRLCGCFGGCVSSTRPDRNSSLPCLLFRCLDEDAVPVLRRGWPAMRRRARPSPPAGKGLRRRGGLRGLAKMPRLKKRCRRDGVRAPFGIVGGKGAPSCWSSPMPINSYTAIASALPLTLIQSSSHSMKRSACGRRDWCGWTTSL